MDCSPTGNSVHRILQVRMLQWVAIPFSKESSQSRGQTRVSCIPGGFFTIWAAEEALKNLCCNKYKVYLVQKTHSLYHSGHMLYIYV